MPPWPQSWIFFYILNNKRGYQLIEIEEGDATLAHTGTWRRVMSIAQTQDLAKNKKSSLLEPKHRFAKGRMQIMSFVSGV